MSTRPDFTQGPRGRPRTTGELGPIDPRANPALLLEGSRDDRFSLSFSRTGLVSQIAMSEDSFREIYGSAAFEAFSVSIWVKHDGAAVAAGRGIVNGSDSGSSAHWGLDWVTTASGNFWVNSRTLATARSLAPIASPAAWNHLCGTYNRTDGSGATVRLFVNGDNSGAQNGTFSSAKTLERHVPITIASQFWRDTSTSNYGEFKAFGLQLWNRQLTSGEVSTLYNGGTPLRQMTPALVSGLLLWWPLGGGYQEVQRGLSRRRCLVDLSGNDFWGRVANEHSTTESLPTYVEDAP